MADNTVAPGRSDPGAAPVFMVPSPRLGAITDIAPERVSASTNDWIALSRDVLQKKRDAHAKGTYQPADHENISDDHRELRPFGAQFCPALQEMNTIGWLLKWPQSAILERIAPRAWKIEQREGQAPFYKFHAMTSFPQAGENDAISVELGWIVVTPPGVSVLIKNVPNNLPSDGSANLGITFAEGVVRSDRATVPLQVHAHLAANAPKRIDITRGEPMCLLMPFRRERFEMHVMNDVESVEEAAKAAAIDFETFHDAPGRYKALYIEDDAPSPLFPSFSRKIAAR